MEIWKEIENYEETYEVSNLGRIRRKDGYVNSGIKNSEKVFRKGNVLKQISKKNGYLHVFLSKEANTKIYMVHRLVAKAFIENPENKPTVNHINGNKHDNRVENLEWCTHSENHIHAYKTGLQNANHLKKKVRCKQLNIEFESSYAAAEFINLTYFKNSKQVKNMSAKIRSAALGIQKSAYGFTWEQIV